MKNIKFSLLLLIAFTFFNCGDDDTQIVALDFNITNVSGSYTINGYVADITNTANTQGTDVTVSTAGKIGGIFQINISLNANNTYTAVGEYSVQTTVTPVSGSPTVTQEIINVNNQGSFAISDTGSRRITFTATNGDFLDGEYSVNLFDENSLILMQDKTETSGSITTQTITTVGLLKD